MTRLFNNKYSISILVVIAVVFCASQIVFSSSTDVDMYADTPDMFDLEMSEADLTQARSLKSVNTDKLFWQNSNNNDPFISRTIPEPLRKQVKKNIVSKSRLPKLSGFIFGEGSKLAVVNGKVVKEGQNIKDYQIVRIDDYGVQLSASGSRKTITLRVE